MPDAHDTAALPETTAVPAAPGPLPGALPGGGPMGERLVERLAEELLEPPGYGSHDAPAPDVTAH